MWKKTDLVYSIVKLERYETNKYVGTRKIYASRIEFRRFTATLNCWAYTKHEHRPTECICGSVL
jgi:hypothetical protein